MKIDRIDIFQVKLGNTPSSVIVKLYTDDGLYGYGECGLEYETGISSNIGMLAEMGKNYIFGQDPFDTEKIWEYVFHRAFWPYGGGPVVYGAMSAFDNAMWDIKAKAFNVPLYKLLGGKVNEKLRTYASQTQFGWNELLMCVKTEDYVAQAVKAVEDGYSAIKVDPVMFDDKGNRRTGLMNRLESRDIALIDERLRSIRSTIGKDIDILLETHGALGVSSTIQLAKHIEDLDFYFWEEPINSLNPKSMAEIKSNISIPLASGERMYTRFGFSPYIEQNLLQVIQPDLGSCGGITEAMKIAAAARTYDIGVQTHVAGTPLMTAASLHFETACPNLAIHELHSVSRLAPLVDLCIHDHKPIDGYFSVPEIPGIGNELRPDVEKKYLVQSITKGAELKSVG